MSSKKYNSLIELNESTKSKTVFCIHTAGGGLEAYKGLANHFEDRYKFYGIEEPSIFDGFEYQSMQDIATHHVKVIKSVQSDGPYILFGYCSGGPVAHEVANQLRSQGEAIESVTYFNRILSWYDPGDDSKYQFLRPYLSSKYGVSLDSVDWQSSESRGVDYLAESIISVFAKYGFGLTQRDHGWIKKVIKSLCLMKHASSNYAVPDVDFNVFKLHGHEGERTSRDVFWCDFKSSESDQTISDIKYSEHGTKDLLVEPNFSITINKIEEFVLTQS